LAIVIARISDDHSIKKDLDHNQKILVREE